MNGFVLFSTTTFIYFTYHLLDQVLCEVTQPRAGLQRDPNKRFRYAQFIEHFYHVLDVPKIEGVDVQTGRHCLLRCVKNDRCFSTNVGAFHLPNGNVSCELLPTDKYNASEKFKANHTFHHYSILSPCESFPCQHGGTCRALYETNDYSCTCTQNYTGRNCEKPYLDRDCLDLLESGHTQSGVYSINPDGNAGSGKEIGRGYFNVYCDMHTDGGGWIVFQRRQDGSVDFFRRWNDYKAGFGQLTAEFWLGNDNIHRLTGSRPSALRVELEDWSGSKVYAKYGKFNIGDEQAAYRLEVGSYSGTAGDSLTSWHNNMAFTTRDRDNDMNSGSYSSDNCAVAFTGAWWYKYCHTSNLNGQYLGHKTDWQGATWDSFRGYLSLKFIEMKLRRSS